MFDSMEPCCYSVCNLSLAIFWSSNMDHHSRNFVQKSVKLVGAVPSCWRRSNHLLALPRIKFYATAFICALSMSSCSNNPAAMKYLLTYFSQDLVSHFSPSNAFGSGTLIWMFILNLLTGSAVWTSPVGDFGLRNYWNRFYYSNKRFVSLLWDYSGLLAAYCSGTTLAPVARWPDVRSY